MNGICFLRPFQEGQAVNPEFSRDSIKRVAVEPFLASYYDPEFLKLMGEKLKVLYPDFEDLQRAGFISENEKVKIRIVYEKFGRRIVGVQMASKFEIIAGNINMFSPVISEGVTIDKFAPTDLFFPPHFNRLDNYRIMAALTAK